MPKPSLLPLTANAPRNAQLNIRLTLVLGAGLIAGFIGLPVLAVVWRAIGLDDPQSGSTLLHLMQTVLPGFVTNTLLLALGVLLVVLIAGVGAAWLIAAFDFPLRQWLAGLLVLPLAMPAFVMAFAYTDFLETTGPLQIGLRQFFGLTVGSLWFPDIRSIPGAALVLGLSLYPYVYMLVRPAFAERSASLSEAARTLGVSGFALWWKVTLPVARPAIVAGCALVLMETLADFGTVSYFAVDTFAAGIYRAWQGMGDQVAAARLAVMLMVFVGLITWVEKVNRGRMSSYTRAPRPAVRQTLSGARAFFAFVFCISLVCLGFFVPITLLILAALKQSQAVQGIDPRLFEWMLNSALLGGLGAALIVPMALVVAYALRLASNQWVRNAAQIASAGYAIPGLVLAVGLLVIARYLDWIGLGWIRATILLVLLAYCARFFAVAFQGIGSGLLRIAPNLDDSARSLGVPAFQVLRQIHWPLLRPTLAAAFLLVFVDCLKELPATLVLRPFNFDTLAVMAYHFASDERLGAAALPAIAIVLVGLMPTIWLARSQRSVRD